MQSYNYKNPFKLRFESTEQGHVNANQLPMATTVNGMHDNKF